MLPDGRLASGSRYETTCVWDLASGTFDRVMEGHALVSEGDGCIHIGYI